MTARVRGLVKGRLQAELTAAVHGGDLHLERYDRPIGDPGLLGPDSVTWRVHSDPPGMLMGGFASLMLQSLHPLAMAGVDQHSDFRTDPIGRLNRTVAYVLATTFGSTQAAEDAVARVKRIHPHVKGIADDGRPYSAEDPELLTWVHVTEVRCFLAGYECFGAPVLTRAERDQYYAETASLARRLGAEKVPESVAEVALYLKRMQPELRVTPAALEGIHFLRRYGSNRQERMVVPILMNGAAALLPDWAREPLQLERSMPRRLFVDRPLAQSAGRALRWVALPSMIVEAAKARTASIAS